MTDHANWKPVVEASGVVLVMIVAWWAGVLAIDSVLAAELPYERYTKAALSYLDAFYLGLPGWVLAHTQPFSTGVYVVFCGWLVGFSSIIGAGAVRYSSGRALSPAATAVASVVALFVTVTAVEAATTLGG